MESKFWVVSDDTQFVANLAANLERHCGGETTGVPLQNWLRRRQPVGFPQAAFFDLRTYAAWEQLEELQDVLVGPEWNGTALVGMVDPACPLDRAVLADRTLTRIVKLPLAASNLPQLTHVTDGGAPRGSDHRVIEGHSSRFETYMPSLFPLVENLKVATKHDFTVLIVGPTGTGKSTMAKLIHELSPRCEKRFLAVACGSLPKELINSELFGHVRGAFTGADRDKEGKFAAAGGGTILLDEIDTLDLAQQANLLQVIETGNYEPVGSNETRKVQARPVVASNLCLESLIEEGKFRADLYFRLNQLKYELPPLRDRVADIVPLTVGFVQEQQAASEIPARYIDPELIDVLKAYRWPGNIRELRNEIGRAAVFAHDAIMTTTHISPSLVKQADEQRNQQPAKNAKPGLAGEVARREQEAIEHMLTRLNFNRAATARALGISRVTLYNKIRKYGIDVQNPGGSRD